MTTLIQTLDAGILRLTLNRADKRNAFDRDLYAALTAALNAADGNPEVRVVVLGAEGDCFSAGNDIADFLAEPEQGRRTDPPLRLLRALRACRKPLVAQVNGKAVGIGATLLLHCDLVYASEQAALVFPFVALGLCPEGGSTQLIPQLAGHVKAFEWLVLGQPCNAQDAAMCGLVNAVLPVDQLAGQVDKAAYKLAALDPDAVQQSRRRLQQASGEQLDALMLAEMDLFEQLLQGEAAQQALQAFVNR
ncbi:enoyl-CoA hydratase-related protein [Marinobacterium sediminicola]|uniref:Enoyl-CoA hydratase/carnithine racemase n=1 Tax=Marinobacterium sediminicola TaxID=518898 RepID=A0ABY1S4D0_9GAMM|nr:enoyl-CoA hydratase-related protein [Marinobacterium sediminicola]ULG70133.1 enoyl-CoA hydratase-related protein [Marinobacterium sediminicola]SMR78408.1 Enoyl-CoA hydratase/carnithine racemase [Marinobacterium sediminicola]